MRVADLRERWPGRAGLTGVILALAVVGSCWMMPGDMMSGETSDANGMPLSLCAISLLLPAVPGLIAASRTAGLAPAQGTPSLLALARPVPEPPPRRLRVRS